MGTRLYADDRGRRLRQVTGDALAVLVLWWAVRTARRIAASVRELRAIGDGLDRSGRSVDDAAGRAAEVFESIPAVGVALAAPFRTLGDAGRDLVDAGDRVTRAVETVAFWVPVSLVTAVAALLLLAYLPRRLRWIRDAAEVRRVLASRAGLQLLGLRAATNRPLWLLRRDLDDPAAALAEGRYAELAAVELRALGLHGLPADAALTDGR